MKCLSIVYPSGTKIAKGEKTIEVRSWLPTMDLNEDLLIVENHKYLRNEGDADLGKPVAIVKIKNTREFLESDIPAACASRWDKGYYSWELTDVRPISSNQEVLAARGIYDVDFKNVDFTEIRTANLNDIPQIKIIMESIFGPFGRIEEMFTKWISQDQYSVIVATNQEKIIGVCTWHVKTDTDLSKYEVFGRNAVNFMEDQKAAWVLNLAINPDYRKQGLGKKLSFAQSQWLKDQKCSIVVGSSWVNGTDDNSKHLYSKAGFRKLGESKEFMRIQMQNGAICSVCKTSDCNCNSILFGIKAVDLIEFLENDQRSTKYENQ